MKVLGGLGRGPDRRSTPTENPEGRPFWFAAGQRTRVCSRTLGRVAILHRATLTPTKQELLTAHLTTFPAFGDVDLGGVSLIGAYRFDDPAGEVGIESHVVATPLGVVHIPLTYRAGPIDGAEQWLIGSMEHSVLGTRWIYNACGDQVYVQELLRVILTGDTHVEQFVATDDGPVARPSTASVRGTGSPGTAVPIVGSTRADFDGYATTIDAAGVRLVVRHVLDGPAASAEGPALTGTWPASEKPTILGFIDTSSV